MTKLIPNNNYLFKIDNYNPRSFKNKINKYYKFIKKKDNKFIFTNGETNFTLWSCYSRGIYYCYITLEQNNKYRTTQYRLNSKSRCVWIRINEIQLNYLNTPFHENWCKSYGCVTTLEKFIFIIHLYNKINIKKNWKKVPSITKVFQDNYMVQYISEFL